MKSGGGVGVAKRGLSMPAFLLTDEFQTSFLWPIVSPSKILYAHYHSVLQNIFFFDIGNKLPQDAEEQVLASESYF